MARSRMRVALPVLVLVGLLLALRPLPASAMTPAAAAFLRSVGLDPDSAPVRTADADGEIQGQVMGDPEVFSLERLARESRPAAVKQFVATRWFIHQLKADFDHTPLLKDGYNASFLTSEERQLVGRKVATSLLDP